jgi:hypothetical protein
MYIETELYIGGIATLAKPQTLKMIAGLLLCGCFFCCAGTFPRLGSLMSFEMEDQFRNSHSHADFKGRVLVVIGSDREGAPEAENWGKALSQSLKPERDSGRLNLIGLSNLKGVPFFLKDYVRGKFSQSAGDWALMDWKGLFADSYGFIAGNANVLVFDKEGVLAYQAHFSECRPDQVLSLTAIIRSKLDGPPPVPEICQALTGHVRKEVMWSEQSCGYGQEALRRIEGRPFSRF